jgi:hypothetical protein
MPSTVPFEATLVVTFNPGDASVHPAAPSRAQDGIYVPYTCPLSPFHSRPLSEVARGVLTASCLIDPNVDHPLTSTTSSRVLLFILLQVGIARGCHPRLLF